ncbi:unnamed protein product [Urochloa decumbens]|uniref:F-box domain-containing protein n=1 Tax=Urochloa decumbens TaxID=240449 RepID=A0ABC9D760_9POAL
MAPLPPAGGRRRCTPACKDHPIPTAPRKRRRRTSTSSTPEPAPSPPPATAWVFPVKVLLEIVARSDTHTLVRCAAVCKALRRGILSPAFLRRVTGHENPADRIVPPYLLGYVHTYDEEKEDEELPDALFSMVHPDPSPVGSFPDKHLAPFISRSAADLLGVYKTVTSRGGLIVLERRKVNRRRRSERRSDMCVYNPMTGERTFFPYPPDYWSHYHLQLGAVFVLLTAGDGIGCAFMLLIADLHGFMDCSCTISVQTMSSDTVGTWSPTKYVGDAIRPWHFLEPWRGAVVLRGGHIHWLAADCCSEILTYNVLTSKTGSIKLPCSSVDILHLGISPDGRLKLLVADKGFIISVWLLLACGTCWELNSVIDMEEKVRHLDPEIPLPLLFKSSGEKSGVALLQIRGHDRSLVVLDVETGEMHKIADPCRDSLLVEVDLLSVTNYESLFVGHI